MRRFVIPPIPPKGPSMATLHDLQAFSASVEKLCDIQERTNATRVFAHDAEQIHQLRMEPEGSHT